MIGTYSQGSNGSPLSVTLNAGANVAAIQALLRTTAYSNTTIVSVAPRYVRLKVVDETGKISNQPIAVVVTELGAPVVGTLSPVDDATNVGIATNLVVTFNETVVKGTGNILIKKISDNSVVQTIDVTNSAVTVSGAVVTIDPANLLGSTGYYIEIPATAFRDLANNAFIGMSGATTWNFNTVNNNAVPTGTVTINDTTPAEDQLLTASNNLADSDGLGTFTYIWQRSDNAAFSTTVTTVGTNSATFTPGDAEVGKFLRVTISYMDGKGNAESVSSTVTSAVANVNDIPTGTVTIDATNPVKDQLLTASNNLSDNDGLGTITYIWERAENLGFTANVTTVGANQPTFTPGEFEVGKFLRATIRYTDGNGTLESVSSAVTAEITVPDTPSVTNASTDINTQTTSGLVISRDAANRPEVTHFKITNITGGSLFENNGTTPIIDGDFITFVKGNAGLRFTPTTDSTETGHFTIQASIGNADTGLSGSAVTADIAVKPAAPVLTGPASLTDSQRPVITWNASPGADKYVVAIISKNSAANPVVLKTVTGTRFTPTADLGIGVFTVRVRAVSASGASSSYSVERKVRISTPVVFENVTRFQSTANPGLTWKQLPGAVKYDLWINNLTTGQQQVVREINLTARSWTSPTSLPMGGYRAWVRGIDAAQIPAAWSNGVDFYVLPTVPVAGALQSTFDTTPTFKWSAVAGASGYDLYLRNLTTGKTVSSPKDIIGTSFTQPTNLIPGNYRWSVYAVASGGYRSQAATSQDIEVGRLPALLTPAANTTDATPTFSWTPVGGTATYNLYVTRVDVITRGIVDVSGITGTSYTTDALPIGSYRAWVRAVSATGEISAWNVAYEFSITVETAASVTIRNDLLPTLLAQLDGVSSQIREGSLSETDDVANSAAKSNDARAEENGTLSLDSVGQSVGNLDRSRGNPGLTRVVVSQVSHAAEEIIVDALMADAKSMILLLEI